MILSVPLSGQKVNSLTPEEQKAGWVLLFNGKDFTGWRQYNGIKMPKNWIIEDNAMKVFTAAHKRPGRGSGGDIIFSAKKFRNFELSVDWKTSRKGNSGIFYNVREVPGKAIYYAAPEVQILDNANASDNKTGSHLAGSLYDMLAADPKTVKPAGEWNTIAFIRPISSLRFCIVSIQASVFSTLFTPRLKKPTAGLMISGKVKLL